MSSRSAGTLGVATLLTTKGTAQLLKVRDAAALLGVSTITVRRRVRDNTLPHFRIMGQIYFKLNELNAFVESTRGGPFV